ncbi:MAG TPA: hypothetical protein PLP33_16650 [Leptospiraceae bacterium]|nr:hypothetical protein [Leptospiraceae bacterium]
MSKTFDVPVEIFLQDRATIKVVAESEEEALETVQTMSEEELLRKVLNQVTLDVEIFADEIELNEDDDEDEDEDDIDLDDDLDEEEEEEDD